MVAVPPCSLKIDFDNRIPAEAAAFLNSNTKFVYTSKSTSAIEFQQRPPPLSTQTQNSLIPQHSLRNLTVEALEVVVLDQLACLNQFELNTVVIDPSVKRVTGELRTSGL
jgi:hypothetical protein